MWNTSNYRLTIDNTPAVVRYLITAICTLTLFTALTERLFVNFFQTIGPQELFSLSWSGLQHGFLWQPLTYILLSNSSIGIDIFSLISLFFSMYILWIIGSMVQERIGNLHFLGVYFLCGLLTGVTTLLVMPLLSIYQSIWGTSASLFSLFTVWTMLNPEAELRLFFLFPFSAPLLLASFIAIAILTSFSQLDLISLIFYLSAFFWGYVYGLLILGVGSPFAFTQSFDSWALRLRERMLQSKTSSSEKILDIKTGKAWVENEEEFIDKMLTKISKYGEESLTPKERRRMDEISARKAREKEEG